MTRAPVRPSERPIGGPVVRLVPRTIAILSLLFPAACSTSRHVVRGAPTGGVCDRKDVMDVRNVLRFTAVGGGARLERKVAVQARKRREYQEVERSLRYSAVEDLVVEPLLGAVLLVVTPVFILGDAMTDRFCESHLRCHRFAFVEGVGRCLLPGTMFVGTTFNPRRQRDFQMHPDGPDSPPYLADPDGWATDQALGLSVDARGTGRTIWVEETTPRVEFAPVPDQTVVLEAADGREIGRVGSRSDGLVEVPAPITGAEWRFREGPGGAWHVRVPAEGGLVQAVSAFFEPAREAGARGETDEEDAQGPIAEMAVDASGRDLVTAANHGEIEFTTSGAGIRMVALSLRRRVRHPLKLSLPVGAYFLGRGPSGHMVARQTVSLTLEDDEWHHLRIPTACASLSRPIPACHDSFTIRLQPEPEALRKLMPAIEEAGASYAVAQAAIWIVTDDADYADLGVLKARPVGQVSGGTRVLGPHEAVEALRLCHRAGIEIRATRLWLDREKIGRGIQDQELRDWLAEVGREPAAPPQDGRGR